MLVVAVAAGFIVTEAFAPAAPSPAVRVLALPAGGTMPSALIDRERVLHVVYYADQNVLYTSSRDSGATFAAPVRVNDRDRFALGGLFRGPEIAAADDGSLHVVWYNRAWELKLPISDQGTMYARRPAGGEFEPSRYLSRGPADGLSIAAERMSVVAAWQTGEVARIVRSDDTGTSFVPEIDLQTLPCECCDTALDVTGGMTYIAVRDRTRDDRDMYLVAVDTDNGTVRRLRLDTKTWHIAGCPMSSVGMTRDGRELFVSWEHDGSILLARVDLDRWEASTPVTVSDSGKYPLVLRGADALLVAWKDGTRLRWQAFERDSLKRLGKGSAATASGNRPAGVVAADGTYLLLP